MPKRRDTGRDAPLRRPDEPLRNPPEQAEVERALESIVERLKPKPGPATGRKPARKSGPAGLQLVWSRDGEGG